MSYIKPDFESDIPCKICGNPIRLKVHDGTFIYKDHPDCHSVIKALKSLNTVLKNTNLKINYKLFKEYIKEVSENEWKN